MRGQVARMLLLELECSDLIMAELSRGVTPSLYLTGEAFPTCSMCRRNCSEVVDGYASTKPQVIGISSDYAMTFRNCE